MSKLKAHLDSNPADIDTANKALDDMKTLANRKIGLLASRFVVNTALGVTMVASKLSLFGSVVTPSILIARSTVIGIIDTYNIHSFDKGLELPSFSSP